MPTRRLVEITLVIEESLPVRSQLLGDFFVLAQIVHPNQSVNDETPILASADNSASELSP